VWLRRATSVAICIACIYIIIRLKGGNIIAINRKLEVASMSDSCRCCDTLGQAMLDHHELRHLEFRTFTSPFIWSGNKFNLSSNFHLIFNRLTQALDWWIWMQQCNSNLWSHQLSQLSHCFIHGGDQTFGKNKCSSKPRYISISWATALFAEGIKRLKKEEEEEVLTSSSFFFVNRDLY
jgi:hypothetical protein